jgi:multidrug resistance efflux pump
MIRLAIAVFLLAACARRPDPGFAGVVESREIQAGSKVGGRVAEVYVEEGQMAEPGALLVRFESRDVQTEREQLQARLFQAEAALARVMRGHRKEEIEQAEAQVRQQAELLQALREGPRFQEIQQAEAAHRAALAEARNAQSAYERLAKLYATGDVSSQAHDAALARRDSALAQADAARERLDLLRAGTRVEEVRAAEARLRQFSANALLLKSGFRAEDIDEARARVAEVQALLKANAVRLAESEVRSPVRARVESVAVRPGDLAPPQKGVVSLLELDRVWVRIFVPETRLSLVKVGQQAVIRVDGLPDKTFAAAVESVNATAEYLPRNIQTEEDRSRQVFGVKVRPADHGGALKPGMAAFVTLGR